MISQARSAAPRFRLEAHRLPLFTGVVAFLTAGPWNGLGLCAFAGRAVAAIRLSRRLSRPFTVETEP